MEAVDERNRQSAVHSLVNRDYQYPASRDQPERSYPPASSMAASAVISPVTMYPNHPPPPYPHLSSLSATNSLSGLISPPDSYGADSRRTSDDTKDSAPQRQSLPSIQEALLRPGGYTSGPPPPPPPLSTTQSSYPPNFSQPPSVPAARPYANDSGGYPGQNNPPPSQRNSPPQPVHPPSLFSGIHSSYPEHNRQPSLPSLRTALPPQPSPYPPSHAEPPRYDPDPRSADRSGPTGPPDNYSLSRLQDDRYQGYPSAPSNVPGPGYPPRSPYSSQMPFAPRLEKEVSDVHLKNGEPEQPYVFNKVLKRGLSNHDLEMALAELNDCSYQISKISTGLLQTVQRYQRSEPGLPSLLMQGVPSMRDFDSIIEYRRRLDNAIQNVKACMDEQQYVLEDQHNRNQSGKPAEYGEETWGSDKDQGFGTDAKKRRGRAAPPGRCHSCNRAETPEWRRGPDGARTLCNACGLHYAKLTRRMGSKQAQSATSSSLRPKSMDDNSPRP